MAKRRKKKRFRMQPAILSRVGRGARRGHTRAAIDQESGKGQRGSAPRHAGAYGDPGADRHPQAAAAGGCDRYPRGQREPVERRFFEHDLRKRQRHDQLFAREQDFVRPQYRIRVSARRFDFWRQQLPGFVRLRHGERHGETPPRAVEQDHRRAGHLVRHGLDGSAADCTVAGGDGGGHERSAKL